MARLIFVVALCLLVASVVHAGRNKAAKKAARQERREELGTLSCGNVCTEDCGSMRTCKDTCRTQCTSAANKKLCTRNCMVNTETCDKATCVACKKLCNAQKLTCKTTSCATECPATLKKYLKNSVCKECMLANCA